MSSQTFPGVPAGAGGLFDVAVHDELLRSTVRLARLAFNAGAASVFLHNSERDELVFEASSGEGEDRLVGLAIPADRGVAGWVWSTGETLVVRHTAADPRFDRRFAEETGYVPNEIMAALLECNGEPIGVIEVLDAKVRPAGELAAMDLLTELAIQCSTAISLLQAARKIQPSLLGRFRTEPLVRLDAVLSQPNDAASEELGNLITALANLVISRR